MSRSNNKGEKIAPPTRACVCGHNRSVHSRGWCGVASGCDCDWFVEDRDVPKLVPGGAWLASGRYVSAHARHAKRPA